MFHIISKVAYQKRNLSSFEEKCYKTRLFRNTLTEYSANICVVKKNFFFSSQNHTNVFRVNHFETEIKTKRNRRQIFVAHYIFLLRVFMYKGKNSRIITNGFVKKTWKLEHFEHFYALRNIMRRNLSKISNRAYDWKLKKENMFCVGNVKKNE